MKFKAKPVIAGLQQSGIRRASARCAEIQGINLGQGVCDLPLPKTVANAAFEAMQAGHNLYGAKEGLQALREKLAAKIANFNKIPCSTDQVIVSHGSTGAYVCAAQVLFEPGDEVVLFEPFYGYHRKVLELQGVQTRVVPMSLVDFSFDVDQLKSTITPQTKAIVICTPCNPTGKVFSKTELLAIGRLAKQHNLWIVTDEIYEYITYPGFEPVSIASLEDFAENTITISGFSKTYNMTGWRLGYVSGPLAVIEKMALVQDLLYVCPSTPLQYGALAALDLPDSYYEAMRAEYLEKRDLTIAALQQMGFGVPTVQGSYYLMADTTALGFADDVAAAEFLLEKARVASVTGSSFFADAARGRRHLRFCFGLETNQLKRALQQLAAALAQR